MYLRYKIVSKDRSDGNSKESAEHSWEWIDACPTQEDARRRDKILRCGGVGEMADFGGAWIAHVIYHGDVTSALNEVRSERGRGGRRST